MLTSVLLHQRLIANILLRAMAAALAFAAQILLVGWLGPTGYGSYVLFAATCSLVFVLSSAGVDVALLKRTAINHAQEERRALLRDLYKALTIGLILAVFWTVAAEIFRRSALLNAWSTVAVPGFPWLLGGVVFISGLAILVAALRGIHRFVAADTADSIVKPLSILGVVALLSEAAGPPDHAVGYAAFIAGHGIAIVFATAIVWKAISAMPRNEEAVIPRQVAFLKPKESFVLVLYALVSYAFFQFDTLLVGLFRGPEEVGAYNMACNFVRLVIFLPLIVAARLQPSIAVMFKERRFPEMLALVRASLYKSMLAATLAAVALGIFGHALLRTVNPAFIASYPALVILAVAHIANSALIVLAAALLMCGYQRLIVQAQLAGLALCLPLYFVLIPRWGMTGAAIAVLVGLGIHLSALAWLIQRRLHEQALHEILLSKAQ